MDRYINNKKKWRLFKEFQCIDIVPYSLALIMLVMEVYILLTFLRIAERISY